MVCTIDDLLVEAVEGATFLHCRVDENGQPVGIYYATEAEARAVGLDVLEIGNIRLSDTAFYLCQACLECFDNWEAASEHVGLKEAGSGK